MFLINSNKRFVTIIGGGVLFAVLVLLSDFKIALVIVGKSVCALIGVSLFQLDQVEIRRHPGDMGGKYIIIQIRGHKG